MNKYFLKLTNEFQILSYNSKHSHYEINTLRTGVRYIRTLISA